MHGGATRKLSPATAAWVRRAGLSGAYTYRQLADWVGVSPGTICNAVNKKGAYAEI